MLTRIILCLLEVVLLANCSLKCALAAQSDSKISQRGAAPDPNYVLGQNDQVRIWALGIPELSSAPFRVDESGAIDLPMLGRIHVAGLTLEQVKNKLITSLKTYVKEPDATVSLAEYGSQSVSIIGAVNSPGMHQLKGNKRVMEVLSMAGGLRPDAGYSIKITRQAKQGAIPLPNAKNDSAGDYGTAEVNVEKLLNASKPEENIIVRPGDIISVPRAQMIYVIGQVRKPGGFVLNERESVSVLQALSLAEGFDRTASPKNARILRENGSSPKRQEIAVNLSRILSGESNDVAMQSADILFIPNSAPKAASARALEAAIQISTGIIIWRR